MVSIADILRHRTAMITCPTASTHSRSAYLAMDEIYRDLEGKGLCDPPAPGKCSSCRTIYGADSLLCPLCVEMVPRTPFEAIVARQYHDLWIYHHADPVRSAENCGSKR